MIRLITLTTLVFILFSTITTSQPVVTSAYFLEWDNSNSPGVVDTVNIYLSATPNITPDGNPSATVDGDETQWPISVGAGTYYAVVTFVGIGPNNEQIETAPSNEISFIVMAGPSNLRITQ